MEKNYSIGVLFADHSDSGLTHDYFASILDQFKRTCEAKGYTISFLNCNREREKYSTYLEQTKQRKYDGILIMCIDFHDPEVSELTGSGIPIVVIDEEVEGAINVKSDNIMGIRQLVHYLGEMGHERIAYILGDDNEVTSVRLQSFKAACSEIGVEVTDEYIRHSEYRNMSKSAYQTEQLLRLKNPPTCIMYPDDFAAIGGINILRARGMEIPENISVTGYDGVNILSQYEPRLTTIRQNTVQIGRIAAQKLIECIEDPEHVDRNTVIVETVLEKGKTVGKVF